MIARQILSLLSASVLTISSVDARKPFHRTRIATGSYSNPNHRMDWTDLPSHVSLIGRSVHEGEDLLAGVDLLVVASDIDSSHQQQNVQEPAEKSSADWIVVLLDFVNRRDLDHAFLLLQREIEDSPVGTVSSRVLIRPVGCDQEEEEPIIPSPCLVCLKVDKNLTMTVPSTESSAPMGDFRKKAESLGRSLGDLVGKEMEKQKKRIKTEDSHKRRKKEVRHRVIRVLLPSLSSPVILRDLSTAFWSSLYEDKRFKGTDDGNCAIFPVSVELILNNPVEGSMDDAIQEGAAVSAGIYLCRDIVNAPHNSLNSLSLGETARRLTQQHRSVLSCEILTSLECEQLGMGAFLGVARGSETEPQFIHITYRPKRHRKIAKRLGLIGKGVLFDTGGYNIKTSMMELMKFDCGGAAAVLGAARTIAELKPKNVEIHFCVAACENMISDRAYVPSDILTASNGKTIEVINTDAEGRLTMADALVYTDRILKCDEIVELSTLTGACMVSLGSSVAGLWSASDTLAHDLLQASKACGEQIWRMPLVEEYKEQLKSKIADIKNLGTRYGGAISAALFLQNFVDEDTPYAHIDMAGPVWDLKAGQASGWGVKLLCEFLLQRSSDCETLSD